MRPWILIFLVFTTIFLLTETRRKQEIMKQEEAVQQQKAVVLQSDHFYSETEKSKSFDMGDIQKDKPIIFLLQLENEFQSQQALEKNPVTVTLTAGKQTKKCVINHLHALCVLPSTEAQKGNFKVQCQKTPCSVKWKLQQPETIQTDGKHTVNHLVSVNQQKDHAMLKVFCTDPEIRKDLDSKIEMFTNSKYDKVVNQEGQIIYFFQNEEKGEYFISTKDKAIEKCTVAHLEHSEDTITLKKQGFEILDFFVNHQPNIYAIDKSLQTDLRIEFLLHEAQMEAMRNTTWIQIQLIGLNGKKDTSLNKLTLDVDDEKEFITFNMIFKKPEEKFEKYQIHTKSYSERYLIATMRFVANDLHQVQFEEESYFQLKKGEKIKYQMVPLQAQEKNIQTVNFFISDSAKFKLSKDSCDRKGCQFQVQALQSAKGFIYLGEDVKKLKAAELIEEQFQNSIGAKVSQGEQKFYLYKMKGNDAVQILVNSPNVIVYVANKQLCRGQNLTKCHQKQVNYHNPAIYESTQDIDLVFLVRALDSAKFVLTVVDVNAPHFQLKDTEPFVYLMDSNENTLTLHFKIPQKQDVSFNLISPLKELQMIVFNQEKLEKIDSKKQSQAGEYSSQGFVQFAKEDLKCNSFMVIVHKSEQHKGKFAHFTLIASTKESNLILEPSNPHYQKLPAKATRDYVFALQPNKKLFLNIHTSNSNNPQLKLKVSNVDEYNNQSNTVQFQIKEPTDVLNLQTIGERLCEDRQSQCQIFIRLISEMNTDVQVTLTLMIENSIIQLKDGIWQNYDLNEAVSSAHFYFLPKHNKHSITIFYHSSLVNLKVASTLWKSDDTSIDISEWPFPHSYKVDKSKQSFLQFKPPQFIHIDAAQLQKCWPYCVVLLSVAPQKGELDQLNKSPSPVFTLNHSFRIMASNNFVKVPQKHKIDVVLNKQEDKYFLVDLKNYMDKQSVVFFTSFTIGSTQLKANVYSETNPRCPTVQEAEADFNFIGIETEIEIQDVKKKLQDNKMNNDKSTYLCILGHAFVESKFSLQFIPEGKDIKPLQIDSTTQVKLKVEEIRMYEIHAHFQFFLKLSRTSGFPYISKKLCNPVNDMEKCLEDFTNSDQKGDQFVNKVMSLTQTPCAGCMYYLKITAKQQSQLTIHAQSRFIEIQMKQSSPLTDVLSPNALNKYLITGLPDKELLINIQIISGNLKVQLNDYSSIAIKKENKKGTNNIHIAIPPKDLKSAKTTAVSTLTSFQFSANFVHLHLSVQSQDSKSPASYVITYSNGEPQTYLEDGLIASYNLIPKKKTTFLYSNPSSTSIYLHLATAQAQTLNKLKVIIFTLENVNDQQSTTELNVKKQDFQKKTVNPTMLMHLPGKTFYVIEVQNQNAKDVLLFIGVNNKQIIYLPLDHEFPFRVQPKQYMYFVVSAVNAGYLRFTLNKCDDSQPYISYTNDYNDFVSQNFQTEEQVTDSLIYDNVIKVKQAGSLYFKIRAQDIASSTLTVKATFSPNKINLNNAKAGNKGNLQYQFMDSQTAQISYSGVVCEKNCGDFTYSAIRSDNISSIIAQLVCTSVSFDLLGFTQTKQPEILPIKATTSKDNKLAFNLPIKQDFNYVGVKAVNSKSGAIVYYQPVEITTFKGKITRAIATASQPTNLSWIIGIVLIILICVTIFAYRRYQKKIQAYRPVGYDEMQDAVN